MKRFLLAVLGIVVLGVIALGIFVATFKPAQRPALDVKVARTPEQVARGEYLVTSVLGCGDCHSTRDWTKYGGPQIGAHLGGGEIMDKRYGFPGSIQPPNITPDKTQGIGDWTDGEIMRAIREGIDRQGKPLFPFMPYEGYKYLSDGDTEAVVAYLRSIPAAPTATQPKKIDFPVGFFTAMVPQPLKGPVVAPPREKSVQYGEYLSKVAGCYFCHTPVDSKMQALPDMLMAGGQDFHGPWGVVRSGNLTMDPETGIGAMDREAFIDNVHGQLDPANLVTVTPDKNTVMPWITLHGMTREDLGSIYDFLQTIPKRKNQVEKRPAAS